MPLRQEWVHWLEAKRCSKAVAGSGLTVTVAMLGAVLPTTTVAVARVP